MRNVSCLTSPRDTLVSPLLFSRAFCTFSNTAAKLVAAAVLQPPPPPLRRHRHHASCRAAAAADAALPQMPLPPRPLCRRRRREGVSVEANLILSRYFSTIVLKNFQTWRDESQNIWTPSYATVRLTSIYLPQNGYKFAATPGAQTIKFYGCKD
jgi:hypothetical protein